MLEYDLWVAHCELKEQALMLALSSVDVICIAAFGLITRRQYSILEFPMLMFESVNTLRVRYGSQLLLRRGTDMQLSQICHDIDFVLSWSPIFLNYNITDYARTCQSHLQFSCESLPALHHPAVTGLASLIDYHRRHLDPRSPVCQYVLDSPSEAIVPRSYDFIIYRLSRRQPLINSTSSSCSWQ